MKGQKFFRNGNPYPPLSFFLWYYMSFFIPVFLFPMLCMIPGYLPPLKMWEIFMKPVYFVFYFTSLVLPGNFLYIFLKPVFYYDGTQEMALKAGKNYKRFTVMSLIVPLLINVMMPIMVANRSGFPKESSICGSIMQGGFAGIGLFFTPCYVMFIHSLNRYMKFIPLRTKYKGAELRVSALLVSVLNAWGIVALITCVMLRISEPGVTVYDYTVKTVFLVALLAVIVAGIDMYALVYDKQQRIKALDEFADRVSEGDYTSEHLEILSRDSFGLLARNFNRFSDRTRELIMKIQESGNVTQETAEYLEASVKQVSEVISGITSLINDVKKDMENQSAGVEETHATVNQISGNLEVMNHNVEQQASSVANASSAIEQMVANIKSVNSILEQNEKTIAALNDATAKGQKKVEEAVETSRVISQDSEGMKEASSVIQRIASQTNLLAMNAAIEAAHAGDAGKGFAVVADEIRKLSEVSNTQSKSISDRLENLASSIQNVLMNISDVQEEFGSIYKLAQQVQNQEAVITQAMNEQNEGSVQVINSVHEINENTDVVKRNSEEMLTGSKEVLVEMAKLSETSAKIEEVMDKMTSHTVEIDHSLQVVEDFVQKNSEAADQLAEQASKFKI